MQQEGNPSDARSVPVAQGADVNIRKQDTPAGDPSAQLEGLFAKLNNLPSNKGGTPPPQPRMRSFYAQDESKNDDDEEEEGGGGGDGGYQSDDEGGEEGERVREGDEGDAILGAEDDQDQSSNDDDGNRDEEAEEDEVGSKRNPRGQQQIKKKKKGMKVGGSALKGERGVVADPVRSGRRCSGGPVTKLEASGNHSPKHKKKDKNKNKNNKDEEKDKKKDDARKQGSKEKEVKERINKKKREDARKIKSQNAKRSGKKGDDDVITTTDDEDADAEGEGEDEELEIVVVAGVGPTPVMDYPAFCLAARNVFVSELQARMDFIPFSSITVQRKLECSDERQVHVANWNGSMVTLIKLLRFPEIEALQYPCFTMEANIHTKARHPHLAAYLGVSYDPQDLVHEHLYLIGEYYQAGRLSEHLKHNHEEFKWKDLVFIARGAAAGILRLHELGITHRDIQAKNLMLDRDGFSVRVTDIRSIWDSGETLSSPRPWMREVTAWTPPEGIKSRIFDQRGDVFSFGTLLWELATRCGETPPQPPHELPIDDEWDVVLRTLISWCRDENPDRRPSFGHLLAVIEWYWNVLTSGVHGIHHMRHEEVLLQIARCGEKADVQPTYPQMCAMVDHLLKLKQVGSQKQMRDEKEKEKEKKKDKEKEKVDGPKKKPVDALPGAKTMEEEEMRAVRRIKELRQREERAKEEREKEEREKQVREEKQKKPEEKKDDELEQDVDQDEEDEDTGDDVEGVEYGITASEPTGRQSEYPNDDWKYSGAADSLSQSN